MPMLGCAVLCRAVLWYAVLFHTGISTPLISQLRLLSTAVMLVSLCTYVGASTKCNKCGLSLLTLLT